MMKGTQWYQSYQHECHSKLEKHHFQVLEILDNEEWVCLEEQDRHASMGNLSRVVEVEFHAPNNKEK